MFSYSQLELVGNLIELFVVVNYRGDFNVMSTTITNYQFVIFLLIASIIIEEVSALVTL